MPTPRELFLQNRLAVCASLLFRITRYLLKDGSSKGQSLLIECELFFSETKSLLAAELHSEASRPKATPTAANPAAKSGAGSYWIPSNGSLSPGPAPIMPGTMDKSPVPSSNPSSGGISSTETPSPSNSPTQARTLFAMRLKSVLLNGSKRTNELPNL